MEALSVSQEAFEKLEEKTILNIIDQNGGNAGQFVHANDMDEIMKVVHEVTAPYKAHINFCESQINHLEDEIKFLRNLLERQN